MNDDDRLGPPPVEPMSEAAWSRVERGLWLRMDAAGPMTATAEHAGPASRRWWMVAAPLAAVAAVVVIVLATRPHPATPVDARSRVETRESAVSVTFADSYIEVDPYSALETNHESGHPTVQLERGAARFTVAPLMGRTEFVVRAGDAMVRVVGTRFRVARSEEHIAVEVDRGLVNVQFRGSLIEVGANQRWSSATPAQISTLASRPPAAPPVASTEPSTEPSIDMTDEPALAPSVPAGPQRAPRPTQRDVKPGSRPDGDPGPGATHAASDDIERSEYERLARLEPTRPETALNGYLALARGTSRWADLALFAAARLAADRRDRRAETLLGIYLQRFPDGANAADARQLLARLKSVHP